MIIYTVVGLSGGCLEDLKVFLEKAKAKQFRDKIRKKYGSEEGNLVAFQVHDVSFENIGEVWKLAIQETFKEIREEVK